MANNATGARQRLDFEDDEAREERLGKLFQDISKTDTPESASPTPRPLAESKPYAMPESDVLARVRAFLPDFQASTAALMARASLDPDAVNLENVGKGERAIAMDLGLGVYDAPGAAGTASGLGPVVESDASGLKEEEEEDSEDEEEEEDEEMVSGGDGSRRKARGDEGVDSDSESDTTSDGETDENSSA